ncbi:MAG: fimbria/pilus outer membrane usher protein [Bdellovibrionaceae bacterium]|nr:fimbria/pilus outer membrane usher protein [Pseudobdellovibrionaceae bacterium]
MTSTLLALIVLFSLSTSWAQTRLRVNVVADQTLIGEVDASFTDPQKDFAMSRRDLQQVLAPLMREDKWRRLEQALALEPQVPLSELRRLGMKAEFDETSLEVRLQIPLEMQRVQDLSVAARAFSGLELTSDPWAGRLNLSGLAGYTRTDQAIGSGWDAPRGQVEFVQGLGLLTFESLAFYQDREQNSWERGDTSIVSDLEEYQTRVRLGDQMPATSGYLSGLASGGLGVSKQFGIDPTRPSTASRSALLQIQKPSLLEISVNQVQIARLRVPAGPFNLRDLPLLVGRNKVHVKITDDFGASEEFEVDLFFDSLLLGKGIHDFSYFAGRPWQSVNRVREYDKDGFVSVLHRYGVTDQWTLGVGGQNYAQQSLAGFETGVLTAPGVWQFDLAGSRHQAATGDNVSGSAERLRFRSSDQDDGLLRRVRLFLDGEHRSSQFAPVGLGLPSLTDFLYRGELMLQSTFLERFAVGAGGGYQKGQNGFEDARLYRGLLQMGFGAQWRFDISYNRTVRAANADDQWLFNLTWIESTGLYSSNVLYDSLAKQGTVAVHKNARRLNGDFSADVSWQKSDPSSAAPSDLVDGRLNYLGSRFEGLLQHRTLRGDFVKSDQTQVGLQTAVSWSQGRFGWSRPIPDAGAFLATREIPPSGKLLINPGSEFSEAEMQGQHTLVLPHLGSYQKTALQIDSTTLPLGYSLDREFFQLHPKYRGLVFVDLGLTQRLFVRGELVDPKGQPVRFVTGEVFNAKGRLVTDAFFTDDKGRFVMDQLTPGQYRLKLRDLGTKTITLDLPESQGVEVRLKPMTVEREEGT